jgi:hypothetical protein
MSTKANERLVTASRVFVDPGWLPPENECPALADLHSGTFGYSAFVQDKQAVCAELQEQAEAAAAARSEILRSAFLAGDVASPEKPDTPLDGAAVSTGRSSPICTRPSTPFRHMSPMRGASLPGSPTAPRRSYTPRRPTADAPGENGPPTSTSVGTSSGATWTGSASTDTRSRTARSTSSPRQRASPSRRVGKSHQRSPLFKATSERVFGITQ